MLWQRSVVVVRPQTCYDTRPGLHHISPTSSNSRYSLDFSPIDYRAWQVQECVYQIETARDISNVVDELCTVMSSCVCVSQRREKHPPGEVGNSVAFLLQIYLWLSKLSKQNAVWESYCDNKRVHHARFLPRDAMHKHGLCRDAVSVCLSVTFMDSVETINTSPKFFSLSHSHIIIIFSIPNVMAIFRRAPHNGSVKIGRMQVGYRMQNFRFSTNSWLSIDDGGVRTTATVHVQFTAQTATHQWIFMYHNQQGWPRRREENGIYLYAAVNLKRK